VTGGESVVEELLLLLPGELLDEVGKSTRRVSAPVTGRARVKKPSHWRPVEVHLLQAGRVSSHLTRRILVHIQQMLRLL